MLPWTTFSGGRGARRSPRVEAMDTFTPSETVPLLTRDDEVALLRRMDAGHHRGRRAGRTTPVLLRRHARRAPAARRGRRGRPPTLRRGQHRAGALRRCGRSPSGHRAAATSWSRRGWSGCSRRSRASTRAAARLRHVRAAADPHAGVGRRRHQPRGPRPARPTGAPVAPGPSRPSARADVGARPGTPAGTRSPSRPGETCSVVRDPAGVHARRAAGPGRSALAGLCAAPDADDEHDPALVRGLLRRLDDFDLNVVAQLYGLDGPARTHAEVAGITGRSESTVRRAERRALALMRAGEAMRAAA